MRLVLAVALVVTWFAEARAESASEVARVRAHLTSARDALAQRDVSVLAPAQRAARAASLANLERYIERGLFPRRTGDDHAGLRPRFIDDRGVHCAVGQLVAESGHEELARSINARFEYAYVREMAEPALVAWATSHGFTVDELAMIQPSYSPVPSPEGVRRMIVDAADAIALRCARQHSPMKSLLVWAFNDEDGATTVTTKSTDPFAKCFVRAASQLDRGRHAFDGGPEEFSLGIDLSFTSPQKQLEKRAAEWKLSCPAPTGAISREATVDITSSREGLVVKAVSSPSNPLVDACVERAAKRMFAAFGAGHWNLKTRKRLPLVPHLSLLDTETLRHYANSEATKCAPDPLPKTRTTISVSAKADDPRFTITATGSPEFAACMNEALNDHMVRSLETSYDDGQSSVRFFRIDTDVQVSVTITVESAASLRRRLDETKRKLEEEMNQIR